MKLVHIVNEYTWKDENDLDLYNMNDLIFWID